LGWYIISKGFASKELSHQFFGNSIRFEESDSLNKSKLQNPTFNLISELVSELLKHKDSKDNFSAISDLIISSLIAYENKYPIEINQKFNDTVPSENYLQESNILECKSHNAREEYLIISNDIHSILSNCSNLTNNQKLEFCNSQRYFMKLFLKDMLIKIKSK